MWPGNNKYLLNRYITAPVSQSITLCATEKNELFFQTRGSNPRLLGFETKADLCGGLAIAMATHIADFNNHESH